MPNQVMRVKDLRGKEMMTVTMNGKLSMTKQIISTQIIINETCKGCGVPNTQVARVNHELVPARVLSVQQGQAKVQGTAVPIDGYALCLACGRRAKLLPVNNIWTDVGPVKPENESDAMHAEYPEAEKPI